VFFGGKRAARRDNSGAVFYYFSNHLGSTSVITNSGGTIVEESDYYPFGGERAVVNNDPNPYKFTGKERDTESGLDFFIARYYSSQQGRFLSPDEFTGGPVDAFSSNDPVPPGPLPYTTISNPQSLNKYAYTYNNPLNYIDLDGHCPDFLTCVTQVTVGAAQGVARFVTNAVSGLLTPARLSNGELATNPSEVNRAMAEGVAHSIANAAEDYASGEAGARFSALNAQERMAVFTEGVLDGAAAVAPAAGGPKTTKPAGPPGENVAAAIGREAHAEFARKVQSKPGWQSQPSLTDPATGKTVQPDALTKSGRPLELKPKTPSGKAAGKTQLKKQERAAGKKGRVVYYDPNKKSS